MAPSLWEAGPKTPVEARGEADGSGQDLMSVFVSTTAGVEQVWQSDIKWLVLSIASVS